jgi:hypothetical protein
MDSRMKKLDLHISAGILVAVCHIESLRAMNQVLDTPAVASPVAALLDLDPNSAGICSFDCQTLNNMLGAAETEDLTNIVETMCRRFMSMPVFQGSRINGAWQLPADGTKLSGANRSFKMHELILFLIYKSMFQLLKSIN